MKTRAASLGALLAIFFCAALAAAVPQQHLVGPGQTLGKIAQRYNVSIEALCNANGILRRAAIKPGQKLWVPDKADKDGHLTRAEKLKLEVPARSVTAPEKMPEKPSANSDAHANGMQLMQVPGVGDVYYFTPTGAGRLGLKPVLMYLHGRGGRPDVDCQRWARVARPLGWLVCPSGPGAMGEGRGWNNNWAVAHRIALASLNALRTKFGRRVQLYGNTLIGFSEGAFVAMNVGVREPHAFNRWLILAANNTYWGGPGLEQLKIARARLRRVYLITGGQDEVIDGTRAVGDWLRQYGVPTRVTTPDGIGHQLMLETKPELYRSALIWLDKGQPPGSGVEGQRLAGTKN